MLSEEEIKWRLRLPLLNKMAELDPQIIEVKGIREALDPRIIWHPRLMFLLRKNIIHNARGSYVLISVRGPRRVGKTTMAKLLIGELLLENILDPNKISPLKVAYIRCDAPWLGGVLGLTSVIRDFLTRRMDHPGDVYLFLDEVSSLKDWQIAVKDLYDSGFLTKHKVKTLITGSHSLDVKFGSEVLALRKGIMLAGGNDKLLLPMKFPEYATYREQISEKFVIRDLFTHERLLELEKRRGVFKELVEPGAKLPTILEIVEAYINELYAYFSDYLITGGYALAIAQYIEKGKIDPGVYTGYVDLVIKDAVRWNLNPDTLHSLLWELLGAPGGPYEAVPIKEVSYNGLARKLGLSHNTVKVYLDYLVEAFVLHEVTKIKEIPKRKSPLKAPRKFYFWDPLIFSAFKALSSGARDPYALASEQANRWRCVLAEMAAATNIANMLMSLEVIQDTSLLRRKMFYHKPEPGKEIDFLVDFEGKLIPIEVYSGSEVESNHIKKLGRLSRQLKVRGILVYSGKETHVAEEYIAIPIPIFLLLA